MFFYIKPGVIHLDCFTQDARVYRFYPIKESINFLPECLSLGVTEYHKNSVSIPMWSDLIIDVKGKNLGYRWKFADGKTELTYHDEAQFKNFIDISLYAHAKIKTPWRIKTKKSLKWAWTYPVYNYDTPDEIIVLSAVVDFKYTHGTDVNIMVNKSVAREIFVKEGVPLVNLMPMTNKRIKIHNHLVSAEEYTSISYVGNLESRFFGRHRKNIKDIDQMAAKCPFGFGK